MHLPTVFINQGFWHIMEMPMTNKEVIYYGQRV
uniref:Uncharacterized protein n=1 Tax=Siphoviridae sp. ctVDy27 TaxID=2827881 RepID=A0A8S5S7F2_9CAUD|nr:MAG TPA: hypothetical protein [Siphoviridae sp. ctVDy27]DAY66164.1 MAG TPA: hypothetical protein [Caudoviricetes sp.]